MKTKGMDNAKVGMLVLAGVLFLVLTLYMIGRNRNLLGSTFTIHAVVTNVNGLVPGNNVRFKGIDVGTVKSITVVNDTAVVVSLLVDKKMKPYLRKNAIASIGTDGLMGNKLMNINSQGPGGVAIAEDDTIQSLKPVETDEMLRTLNTTNENIERITQNLYEITVKLNSSESLWTLLSDTVITKDLKYAVVDFRRAGANTAEMTNTVRSIAERFEHGQGLANQLFTDTALTTRLGRSLSEIEKASTRTSQMMDELKTVVGDIKTGGGTAGLLLNDTAMRNTLQRSALHLQEGTARFNEDMEALKSNLLFRGYFRKLEKKQQKELKNKP